MPAAALPGLLRRGIDGLGLTLAEPVQQQLLAYLALIGRWNRVYNLTAIRDPAAMLTRHLLDSLAVLPWLQGPRLLDVGSGAGLPGIPLALARPDLDVVLLDSSAKRTRFLRQAKAELGLANVTVVTARVESYQSPEKFATLVSRAFTSLAGFVGSSSHLLAPGGLILAMKGNWPGGESGELPAGFRIEEVIRLQIPGLNEERHLVACRGPD